VPEDEQRAARGARPRPCEQAGDDARGDEGRHGLQQGRMQLDGAQNHERPRDLGADHEHHQSGHDSPLARVREHVEPPEDRPLREAATYGERRCDSATAADEDQHGDPPGELKRAGADHDQDTHHEALDQRGRGVDHDHLRDRWRPLAIDALHQRTADDARDIVVDERGQKRQRVSGMDVRATRPGAHRVQAGDDRLGTGHEGRQGEQRHADQLRRGRPLGGLLDLVASAGQQVDEKADDEQGPGDAHAQPRSAAPGGLPLLA
jgi:hypothetical protein